MSCLNSSRLSSILLSPSHGVCVSMEKGSPTWIMRPFFYVCNGICYVCACNSFRVSEIVWILLFQSVRVEHYVLCVIKYLSVRVCLWWCAWGWVESVFCVCESSSLRVFPVMMYIVYGCVVSVLMPLSVWPLLIEKSWWGICVSIFCYGKVHPKKCE